MDTSDAKKNIIFIGSRVGFYSREILRGILSMRSEGCDWSLWCLPTDISQDELDNCIKGRKVEGIIARGLSESLSRYVHGLSIPSVLIRSFEDENSGYINGPHVDDAVIGQLAGQEFSYLNLGYWGFVHWEGVMWSEARKKSFHSCATSLGVRNEVISLKEGSRLNYKAILEIAEWLKGLPKPCGILACNDETGLDVINACHLIGAKVPDEVAVIGVDNDRLLCESTAQSLSSIDLRAADVGRKSAIQLGDMLGSLKSHAEFKIQPATVVVRNSSNNVDRHMLLCQRAIDYIDARVLKNISVTDVAKSCGVSRRGLERAFEKGMGCSPATTIRAKRMKMLEHLLKDSSVNLDNIAHQAGFSDASGLSNFVKRMTGKKPGDFRT